MMMNNNKSTTKASATTTTTITIEGPPDPKQFHFVLVHGFGSGAWSWYKIRALLEATGFKVTCLDLKASGIDPTSSDDVASFDAYNQTLIHFLSNYSPSLPQEKLILVGHSAGGLSVTDATYKLSNKIHVAVYVAASMLEHGFATQQDVIDGMPRQFRSGPKAEPDHMIPPEDAILVSMLSRPGPLHAITEVKFSGTEANNVPRVYIKTLQDQTLQADQQESMISRWPPARVFALDCDHNPIFSAPFLLSGLLAKAADLIV